MSSVIKLTVWIFVILEMGAVAQLWFDRNNEWLSENSLAPGAFKVYSEGDESIRRLVDFFALWVAGNKFIMMALIFICAHSSDVNTRIFSCVTMIIGVSVYFWQQAAVYDEIYSLQENSMPSSAMRALIGSVILPLWLLATASELMPLLQAKKN